MRDGAAPPGAADDDAGDDEGGGDGDGDGARDDCEARVSAARSRSGAMTTRNPRASVHRSSSTEISNDRLVTASQTPGPADGFNTASMPAKKLSTLRCSIITPLGRPVEPDVKIT